MNEVHNKATAAKESSAAMQRAGIAQQLVGVQERLEKKGVGAAFYRAARPDPMGDMGFMGSLLFHALIGGPLEEMIGHNLPLGHGELDNALMTAGMEAISTLIETEGRSNVRHPKSAFYPLGRKKDAQATSAKKAPASYNSRFSHEVQAELAFMFELTDTLGKLEAQEAIEASEKRVHLVVRKPSSSAYQGVERRRQPRLEGMFSA